MVGPPNRKRTAALRRAALETAGAPVIDLGGAADDTPGDRRGPAHGTGAPLLALNDLAGTAPPTDAPRGAADAARPAGAADDPRARSADAVRPADDSRTRPIDGARPADAARSRFSDAARSARAAGGAPRATRAPSSAVTHTTRPAHPAARARFSATRLAEPPQVVRAPHPAASTLADAPKLAVALHDVEPASHARCAEIREWLREFGVDRVTLLVIPAPQLHPFPARSPELVYWLLDCQDTGDAIAQHGLQHRQTRPGPLLGRPIRQWQGGTAAEYAGMSAAAALESVEAGRRVLTAAGLHPRGFVAPAYAYTGALRTILDERFDWWATLLSLRGQATTHSPALCLGTSGAVKRRFSPLVVRAGAALSPRLLRLDLHPADFDHPGHVAAVERVLERARDRVAVTYDDLC